MSDFSLRLPYLIYLSIASMLVGVLIAPAIRDVPLYPAPAALDMAMQDMMHGELEVPLEGAPEISMTVTKDAMSGWNLTLETANFTFTPEQVTGKNIANTGHAHLYVNGEKMARLYAPVFHIPDLPPGQHEIAVSLSSNDHSYYVTGGNRIEARAAVMQDPVPMSGS